MPVRLTCSTSCVAIAARRNQMAIAVVLFMLVIVLAGVLIWVLQRRCESAPAEEDSETGERERVLGAAFCCC